MDKDNNFVVMGEGNMEISVKTDLYSLFQLIDKSFETFRLVIDTDLLLRLKTFDTQAEGFEFDEDIKKVKDKEEIRR